MKIKIIAASIMLCMIASSSAFAYDRNANGYNSAKAEEQSEPTEQDDREKSMKQIEREIYGAETSGGGGGGMNGTMIGGYVLIAVGGVAAIAGSTIIAASDHDILGASIAGGGAAMGLAGTLMITLGSRGGYAVGPSVDPKRGNYGVVLAKRF